MTTATVGYRPHPYIGGRTTVLRALAAWRMEWPGAPRVVVLTGSPGSGRSHLLTGFLMLCDPEFRRRLPLDDLDPVTVPPELPAPAVPGAAGLTAAQLLSLLAGHCGVRATRTEAILAELADRADPLTVVVPDVDRAGPVRATGEPRRVVHEVLAPLAALQTVRLLTELPRELVPALTETLPPSAVQVIDLDESPWTDHDGLLRQAEALLSREATATDGTLAAAIVRRAATSPLVVQLAVESMQTVSGTVDADSDHLLPSSVGEAIDTHARRVGADSATLRRLLLPLALAEGDGYLPVALWPRLATALAGQDLSALVSTLSVLTRPFIETNDASGGDSDSPRTLVRLVHPAIAEAVVAEVPDLRAVQSRMAIALLEAVPEQDWAVADPYVRDHIGGHALAAGLLPQLLTDPGLFVHADPVPLRAAVEAVPPEQLGAPGRTYLRTAPLLTRAGNTPTTRATQLETAFVEDALPEYAAAVARVSVRLP